MIGDLLQLHETTQRRFEDLLAEHQREAISLGRAGLVLQRVNALLCMHVHMRLNIHNLAEDQNPGTPWQACSR